MVEQPTTVSTSVLKYTFWPEMSAFVGGYV